jgi:hypothetical protein
MPQAPIPTDFIINVMEIETCFLAEVNHFEKISPNLTTELITLRLGFDPVNEDMQERERPAEDLDNSYQLVGCRYNKKIQNIKRTINALDYSNIYYRLREKIPSLEKLIVILDGFFHNAA